MKLRTNHQHRDQAQIAFDWHGPSQLRPTWLVEYFESEIARGKRFRSDETIQIGAGIVLLKAGSAEELELYEPDFKAFPVRWQVGIETTIRQISLQQALSNDLGMDTDFACIFSPGMVTKTFMQSRDSFDMTRDTPPDPNSDTGWAFWVQGDMGADAELKSLYEIALHAPQIVPFLSLCPGAHVSVRPGHIEIACGDRRIDSTSSRLLSKLTG